MYTICDFIYLKYFGNQFPGNEFPKKINLKSNSILVSTNKSFY